MHILRKIKGESFVSFFFFFFTKVMIHKMRYFFYSQAFAKVNCLLLKQRARIARMACLHTKRDPPAFATGNRILAPLRPPSDYSTRIFSLKTRHAWSAVKEVANEVLYSRRARLIRLEVRIDHYEGVEQSVPWCIQ